MTCAGCGISVIGGGTRCASCAKRLVKKVSKYAAAAGMVLAIVCQSVPARYQAACNVVSQIVPHACG